MDSDPLSERIVNNKQLKANKHRHLDHRLMTSHNLNTSSLALVAIVYMLLCKLAELAERRSEFGGSDTVLRYVRTYALVLQWQWPPWHASFLSLLHTPLFCACSRMRKLNQSRSTCASLLLLEDLHPTALIAHFLLYHPLRWLINGHGKSNWFLRRWIIIMASNKPLQERSSSKTHST